MIRPIRKVIFTLLLSFIAASAFAATVNINTADATALAKNITGVGPRRADAIINYRKTHGPFKDVQELTKVKGIGQKLVNLNLNRLVVSDSYSHLTDEASKPHKLR